MCGRFTLTNPDPARLGTRFELGGDFALEGGFEFDERPRFNIAPTDPVLAVRRERSAGNQLGRLRWGLLPGRWAQQSGQRPLINARAETVDTQPAFAESFSRRRCLLPADGFYEWREDPEGKRPIWFSRPDCGLFSFAGIWAELPGEREGASGELSCALITCPPNETMRPIHDRMPVVLDPAAESTWLAPNADPAVLLALLRPAPEELLEPREVGDAVNDARRDGPELLEPPLRLF